jgi:hypothetical protein
MLAQKEQELFHNKASLNKLIVEFSQKSEQAIDVTFDLYKYRKIH